MTFRLSASFCAARYAIECGQRGREVTFTGAKRKKRDEIAYDMYCDAEVTDFEEFLKMVNEFLIVAEGFEADEVFDNEVDLRYAIADGAEAHAKAGVETSSWASDK